MGKNIPKDFKGNDPNEIMANKEKHESTPDTISMEAEHIETVAETSETGVAKSEHKAKKKQKYLRLDITDYQDYVHFMAYQKTMLSGKYVSMTQYILKLIEDDKQKNIEAYRNFENTMKNNI